MKDYKRTTCCECCLHVFLQHKVTQAERLRIKKMLKNPTSLQILKFNHRAFPSLNTHTHTQKSVIITVFLFHYAANNDIQIYMIHNAYSVCVWASECLSVCKESSETTES